MAKWIEYTGSNEQIEEIDARVNDILFKLETGDVVLKSQVAGDWAIPPMGITHYLICEPHPYANEIKIWADTGCPVYYQAIECKDFKGECLSDEFNLYPFARPDRFEYRLTPFED